MTKLPTSPFPELHALDETRPMPNLGALLKGDRALPAQSPAGPPSPPADTLSVPNFPRPASALAAKVRRGPAPALEPLPPVAEPRSVRETLARLMADQTADHQDPEVPPPAARPVGDAATGEELDAVEPGPSDETPSTPEPEDSVPEENEAAPIPATTERAREQTNPPRSSPPEATDQDLVDALQPLLEASLQQALFSPATGLQQVLEPMLRNTVRRAIAEQMEGARQFRGISTIDRLRWRLQALFKSRTYDDIVFEHTRRFQVEEAFLLRRKSRSLVSYASHDPARHASVGRIQSTLRSLTQRLRAPDGSIESSFDLPGHRRALVREGRYCLLVAVLRGRSNAMVRADLDYVLRQAEDRFGERLEQKSDAFVYVLQPILEGCLLIQSPAPPH